MERERLHMIAGAIIAQTETLALRHLDGRYASVARFVEVPPRFALPVLVVTAV
jgi:hypothetical protein